MRREPGQERASTDRVGAMTMAMRAVAPTTGGPTVLQVAVVRAGRIVAEHRVAAGASLSVGHSERCDVVLGGAGTPERATLLRGVGEDYLLDPASLTGGRVRRPDATHELGPGDGHLRLSLGDRAMLQLPGATLLLQFVQLPPSMPRPRLPAAVRGQLARRVDWLFAAFCTFSMMSALGFMVALQHMDYPLPEHDGMVPERMARFIFEEPQPPAPPPAPDTEPAPIEPDREAPPELAERTPAAPSEDPPSESPAPPAPDTKTRTAALRDQAASAASALIAGALSAQSGPLRDVLAGGAVIGRAEEILARATGTQVARNDGVMMAMHRGPRDGSGTRPLDQLAAVGGPAATRDVHEGDGPTERGVTAPPGHARLGDGGDVAGSGDFDGSLVVAAIKRRIGAIRACYERALRRDPGLSGKLTMEFTIQPRGNVTGARATADTLGGGGVAGCVARELRRLRFRPGPSGGSVTFAYPFVFAPQG